MKNLYQILEIPANASEDTIKEQYRFLVQAWHPDKFPKPAQKEKAEEKLKEINAAYETLSNPVKRAAYDNSIRSSKFDDEWGDDGQGESQAAQRRAEAEQRKREEATQQKEEHFRKEHADKVNAQPARDGVRVFINGNERILSVEQLVHANVRYFLEGESMGGAFFSNRAHVEAAVNNIARPRGYEIHVCRLAGDEQIYRIGREWPVKNVQVFVEKSDGLEERTVQETDLIGASVRYYFGETRTPRQVVVRNLQDVKVIVRDCKKNNFRIVVEKFAG